MSIERVAVLPDDPDAIYIQIPPAFQVLWDEAYNPNTRNTFMWGGRGGAKSRAMSTFLPDIGRREHGNYLCTREVQASLADSVYGELVDSIRTLGIPGYSTTEKSISHKYGVQFLFAGVGYRNGVNIKSMSGLRRAWAEEAQQLSRRSMRNLTPTVRGGRESELSWLYFSFNRTLPLDPVYEYFRGFKTRKQRLRCKMNGRTVYWNLYRGDGAIGIEINHDGNPFFPASLEADRKHDYAVAMESKQWEEYNHVWKGQPYIDASDTILTLRQVMEALSRTPNTEGQDEIGVDVARGGKDKVTFYRRKGLAITAWREFHNNAAGEKMRTTQTFERLIRWIDEDKDIRIKIDDTGLGGGVTDLLEDNDYNVVPVNFAQRAADSDKYPNAAAEMWYKFADVVDEVSFPHDVDPELLEDLTQRRAGRRDKKARRTVESKDNFRERVGRSPDHGDAALLAFYEPATVITSVEWDLA